MQVMLLACSPQPIVTKAIDVQVAKNNGDSELEIIISQLHLINVQ
jgi:hypothetical protein